MPDFNPLVLQPPTQVQPQNPLTQAGNLVGIRNALQQGQIQQQTLQQQQMATQQQGDNQKFDAYLSQQQQSNPSGTPDLNQAGSWLAQNAPLAFQRWQAYKDGRLALTPQGVDPTTGAGISKPLREQEADFSGSPAQGGQNNIPASNNPNASTSHTIQTGLAPAQQQLTQDLTADNSNYIKNTRAQAATSADAVPILEKIQNLAKKVQTGPQADKIQNWNAGLSEIFGTDPNSAATYEELRKYMLANGLSQASANSADSNERTAHYIATNPNTQILPEAIEPLAAYQEALHKQNIGEANGMEKALSGIDQTNPIAVNKAMTGTGLDNPGYRAQFRNNKNTQLYEYMSLPDKDSKAQYLDSNPQVAQLIKSGKLKNLKGIGATYQ